MAFEERTVLSDEIILQTSGGDMGRYRVEKIRRSGWYARIIPSQEAGASPISLHIWQHLFCDDM